MVVERSTHIARLPADVFDFVADPRNDPLWCPKVVSVQAPSAEAGGPGTRYAVVHRPVPLRPARRMVHTLVSWQPPGRIVWHEDDGHDVVDVVYLLEADRAGTRFTQRSDAQLAVPRFLHPVMRAGIGRDIAKQLDRLRDHLES
jgi:hypothetical protein